jgi:SAM-dependent methyltransferase
VDDTRSLVYGNLHQEALQALEHGNAASARIILSILFGHFRPGSVVDVGCGIGTWLAVAGELGIADTVGVEGRWLDPELSRIPPERIRTVDLESPFDLQRRFDLAISLEVGEHLSASAAAPFVESLVRHSDVVLFSAAIPLQGGDHHVNEQYPDYWRDLFHGFGYSAVDLIRPLVWGSKDVLVWLRQNVLLFVKDHLARAEGPFAKAAGTGPLSIVHPEVYESLVTRVAEHSAAYNQLMEWLSSGKILSAERNADGTISVNVRDPGSF